MTAKELSQLYYINKEIQSLQKELAELRQKNFYKPNIITDMPKGEVPKEQSVEYVSAVMELEELINLNLRKLQYQRKKVEEFLDSVNDADLRLIMRLRAVDNMKWEDIGEALGMERTTVSKKFYRYFRD